MRIVLLVFYFYFYTEFLFFGGGKILEFDRFSIYSFSNLRLTGGCYRAKVFVRNRKVSIRENPIGA